MSTIVSAYTLIIFCPLTNWLRNYIIKYFSFSTHFTWILIVFNFYPAEMLDKEALQQTTATHVAANEIEKLANERADFEKELDIQVNIIII